MNWQATLTAAPLVLAALLLTGCVPAGVGTPRQAQPISIEDRWRAAPVDRNARPRIDSIEKDWWRAFGDPQLTALVEKARIHNAKIGMAVGRIRQARGQESAARGALLPQIGTNVNGQWSRSEIPIELLDTNFDLVSEGYAALPGVQMSYELDLFGRLDNQADAATLARMSATAQLDAVQLSVAAATASAYLQLLALDAQQVLLNKTLELRKASLQLQKERVRTGYSSQLPLRQAEAEYSATLQLVPKTQLAITQTENAIAVLTGEASYKIGRERALADLTIPPIPELLPSELLRRRPDVASAEFQLAAADHSLASARALFFPQINLSSKASMYFAEDLDDPIKLFSVGGSILTPIFEGGRIKGQVEAAAGARDQAAYAFRDSVLQALKEAEDNLAATQRLDEYVLLVKAQYEDVRHAHTLVTQQYDEGYTNYLVLLDVQRMLYSAQQALIQARSDRLNAHINLYRAMGGGWERTADPCAQTNENEECKVSETLPLLEVKAATTPATVP